jgi:hypothetical protein
MGFEEDYQAALVEAKTRRHRPCPQGFSRETYRQFLERMAIAAKDNGAIDALLRLYNPRGY